MSAMDAALDIPLADFASWGEAERMVANVQTLYRGYSGGERVSTPEVLAEMAKWDRRRTVSASM
jgi:cyclase